MNTAATRITPREAKDGLLRTSLIVLIIGKTLLRCQDTREALISLIP